MIELGANAMDLLMNAVEEGVEDKKTMTRLLGVGFIPSNKQWRASGLARQADEETGPTFIGYGGARGGGKTAWAFCQVCCDDLQRGPAMKALFLRKAAKSMKEAITDLRQKFLAGKVAHTFVPSQNMIRFPNKSYCVIGHFNTEKDIDTYLGLEYHIIVVEEATTLTETKVKQIMTCCRKSGPDGIRPRMYFTTNPGGVGHTWFKKMFIEPNRRNEEVDTRFVQALPSENAHLDKGYMAILNSFTGWRRKAWKDGDWNITAGLFFKNFRDNIHVKEFNLPDPIHLWKYWVGFDYGFGHNNAAILIGEDPDGHAYVIDEEVHHGLSTAQNADLVLAMLTRNELSVKDIHTFQAGHDCFSNQPGERTIAQMYQEKGITLESANTDRIGGAGQILDLLGDAEAGVPCRLTFHPRCVRTVEQMTYMEHDEKRPDDVEKVDSDGETGEGGDDAYDALRYGLMWRGFYATRRVRKLKM